MSEVKGILTEALDEVCRDEEEEASFSLDERHSDVTNLSTVVNGVGDAVKSAELELERKRSRINPEPTSAKRRQKELLLKLQDAADKVDGGGNPVDTEAVRGDLDRLCREAGVKDVGCFRNHSAYERALREYRDAEETASEEVSLAKKRILDMEFNGIEDALARIEDRASQIDDLRDASLEALKALYGEICDYVDNSENGEERGGVMGYDRLQKAPLRGEGSKEYQERMRKIGNSSLVPETVKRVDEIVELAERRWQRVASLSPEEFATVKANWRRTVFNLLNRTAIATNMSFADLNDLFEGHLSSRRELHLSKRGKKNLPPIYGIIGDTGRSPLDRFTENTFGVGKDIDDEEVEKYGILHTKFPSEADKLIGSQFGRNVVRWRPESVVATMFCGDSICHGLSGWDYQACPLVSSPSPVSFDPGSSNTIEELKKGALNLGLVSLCRQLRVPYIELQLHGDEAPDTDDIESIAFNSLDDFNLLSEEAVYAIKELGIDVYLGTERASISESGELVTSSEDAVEDEEEEVSDLTTVPAE